MKNLRHPNVVELVGVVWSDFLFACCLEFIPNGSLEDWLRRTAGGKSYDPLTRKKKENKLDVHNSRCGKIHKGFDYDSSYDESLLTSKDKEAVTFVTETAERLVSECRGDDSGSAISFEALSAEDDMPFQYGVQGWSRFNRMSKMGETVAVLPCVNATPSQTFAKYSEVLDTSDYSSEDLKQIEKVYEDSTTRIEFLKLPFPSPLSDREMLWRGFYMKLSDGSFVDVTYDIEDERKPVANGAVRMGLYYVSSANTPYSQHTLTNARSDDLGAPFGGQRWEGERGVEDGSRHAQLWERPRGVFEFSGGQEELRKCRSATGAAQGRDRADAGAVRPGS